MEEEPMPDQKADHKVAFVAMSFDGRLAPVYLKVIKPVLEQSGYECRRADENHRIGMIVEQVQQEISQATLMLCDLTFNNPNVFYELGIAHALGKEPILLSQQAADLPFDVRHLRVITYVDDKCGLLDLRENLVDCLAKEVQNGPRPGAGPRPPTITIDLDDLESQRAAIFSNSPDARRWALKFLGNNRDKVSFDKIVHIATDRDMHPDIVRDAFTALFSIDREQARPFLLVQGLRYQQELLVRERVVELLGKYEPDKELLDQLFDQCGDSSWGVRRMVCETLGRWGDNRAVARLRAMLNDSQAEVRLAAVEALGRFRRDHLGDDAPEVTQEAAATLDRIQDDGGPSKEP
jgi:hypothetical protein